MILENLIIERLIVHEIFQRLDSGSVPPNFSDYLTELEPLGTQELANRIIAAMGDHSHSIQMDMVQNGDGSVYSMTLPLLNKSCTEETYITTSKNIAQKLSNALFSKNIPGGVVVVFEGLVGNPGRRYVGIIKADKHSGFAYVHQQSKNMMQYLSNLLLTPSQKLYKISMIIKKTNEDLIVDSVDNIIVNIYDSIFTQYGEQAAASYFYDNFMGCAYQKTSDKLTLDFYQNTKDFITKQSQLLGEEKVDKMSALYTYLKVDTSPSISVDDFSTRYLKDPELQDSYIAYMQAKKFPMNNVHKDMDKLKHKLKRRKIEFTNKVLLYAPVEDVNGYFEVVDKDDLSTTVKIKGVIKNEN